MTISLAAGATALPPSAGAGPAGASQNLFEHMANTAKGMPEGASPHQIGSGLMERMNSFIDRTRAFSERADVLTNNPSAPPPASVEIRTASASPQGEPGKKSASSRSTRSCTPWARCSITPSKPRWWCAVRRRFPGPPTRCSRGNNAMPSPNRALRLLLIGLLASVLQACNTDLYTNLSERDANAMVAVLLRGGIPAERKTQDNGQLKVVVDEERFAEAMTLLDNAGLPQQSFSNMGEVFKGNGLVSSPVQERAQMIYALSEELSHSVSQIDGIVAARVHVVLPDNDLLKRVISPSSASVLVRYDPGTDINTLIPQIKTLVANGISGLSYDGVSVTAIKAAVAISQNPAQPRLARFMGLWLLEDNLAQARVMFGGLLLIALGALGVLARQHWARRQSQAMYVLKEGE